MSDLSKPTITQASFIQQTIEGSPAKDKTTQINSQFKCIKGNKSTSFCVNANCKVKYSFFCQNEQCLCYNGHVLCLRGRVKEVLNIINQKVLNTQKVKKQIDKTIENAIDQLSDLKQQIFDKIQTQLKYGQLSSLQKRFLQVNENKNIKQNFEGQKLSQLWNIINEKVQMNKQDNDSLKLLIQQINIKIIENIQNTIKTTNQIVQKSMIISQQKQQKMILKLNILKNKRMQEYQESQNVSQILICKSSILNTVQITKEFLNLFPPELRRMERVFKASQHDFSISKYYEICGDMENTVIICRTNADKIIGGYTPLSFNPKSADNDESVADQTNSSFIFSLTNQDKFQLIIKEGAIQRRKDKNSIKFGDDQFNICNAANINKTGRTDVNYKYYYNSEYVKGQKESYFRMNGNYDNQFTIKQWQVWKINLE